MQSIITLLLLCWGSYVSGFGHFRYEIPNGERVSHPCKPNTYWKGVGHLNSVGGGQRNQFGLDFFANDQKWTRALCMKDSDGDGQTNGQELGDPDCVWVKDGGLPSRTDDITHPGICTPFYSPHCQDKNEWVDCAKEEFVCPSLNRTDTQNVTLRFPRTQVPAQETTYMCMIFDLPSDHDYHLVAYKPEIDNDNVMHHIVVFGCSDSEEPLPTEPYPCNMGTGRGCGFNMLGAWTLGSSGDCFGDQYGVQFGKSKYKRVAFQFHWNNPKLEDSWFDSSGMTFFYTQNLRPNNAAMLVLGQQYLKIPPSQPSTTFTASCSSDCTTAAMAGPIHVVQATNHMHYLGHAQFVEHRRNGSRLRYLTNEPTYNYDDPQDFIHDPPVEIMPNDELFTTCKFKSTYSKNWTYFGQSTSDEMCFAFLRFYPAEAMPGTYCINWKSVPLCIPRPNFQSVAKPDQCNPFLFVSARDPTATSILMKVNKECNPDGQCTDACESAILEARKHPCLRGGDFTEYTEIRMRRSKEGNLFLQRLDVCSDKVVPSSGSRVGIPVLILLIAVLFAIM